MDRMVVIFTLVTMILIGSAQSVFSMDKPCAPGISEKLKEKIIAMAERSKKEKKGLTIYLPGQHVAVVVTELIGTEAIVGRNREHEQVLIRLDQISGLAMN